ncbi:arrestin domain-containing protein 3-like [Tubulanus polymorphus]|uniref:arrestin domain-containing protein 3-like n=1 Tax=Tubulanus polymorphus TaxID=672921 RepID=UPI003DA5DACF
MMHKLARLDILFDRDDQPYQPGDIVRGKVVFQAGDISLLITSGILCGKGASAIGWNDAAIENTLTVHTAKQEYFNYKHVFCDKVTSSTDNANGWALMKQRSYQVPFEFSLPSTCPASIHCENGWIRYYVSCHVKTKALNPEDEHLIGHIKFGNHRVYHVRKELFVQGYLNIGGGYSSKKLVSKTLKCGFLAKGRSVISSTLRLDKTGYLPGEVIRIYGENRNESPWKCKCTLKLVKAITIWSADGQSKQMAQDIWKIETHALNRGMRFVWKGQPVTIPTDSTPSLQPSDIISVEYLIEMRCFPMSFLPRVLGRRLCLRIPIVVGTERSSSKES